MVRLFLAALAVACVGTQVLADVDIPVGSQRTYIASMRGYNPPDFRETIPVSGDACDVQAYPGQTMLLIRREQTDMFKFSFQIPGNGAYFSRASKETGYYNFGRAVDRVQFSIKQNKKSAGALVREPASYANWTDPYDSSATTYRARVTHVWVYHDVLVPDLFIVTTWVELESCAAVLVFEVMGDMPVFSKNPPATDPIVPPSAEPQPPTSYGVVMSVRQKRERIGKATEVDRLD